MNKKTIRIIFSILFSVFACNSIFAIEYLGDTPATGLLIKNNISHMEIISIELTPYNSDSLNPVSYKFKYLPENNVYLANFGADSRGVIGGIISIKYKEIESIGEKRSRANFEEDTHNCSFAYTNFGDIPIGSVCNENHNIKLVAQLVELGEINLSEYHIGLVLWQTDESKYLGIDAAYLNWLNPRLLIEQIISNPVNSHSLLDKSINVSVDATRSADKGFKIQEIRYLGYGSKNFLNCKKEYRNTFSCDTRNSVSSKLQIKFIDKNIGSNPVICEVNVFNQSNLAVGGVCTTLPKYSLYFAEGGNVDSRDLKLGYTNRIGVDSHLNVSSSSSSSSSRSSSLSAHVPMTDSSSVSSGFVHSIYIGSGIKSLKITGLNMNFVYSDLSEGLASCNLTDVYGVCGSNSDKQIISGVGSFEYKVLGFSSSINEGKCKFTFTMIDNIPVGTLCIPEKSSSNKIKFKLVNHLMKFDRLNGDGVRPVLTVFRVLNNKKKSAEKVDESAIEDYVSKLSSHYKQLDRSLLNHEKVYKSVSFTKSRFIIGVSDQLESLLISRVDYRIYSGDIRHGIANFEDSACEIHNNKWFICGELKSNQRKSLGGLITVHFKQDNQEKTCEFNQINIEHPYNSKGVIQLGSICINNTQYSVYPDETNPNILRLGLTRDVQSKFIPNLSNMVSFIRFLPSSISSSRSSSLSAHVPMTDSSSVSSGFVHSIYIGSGMEAYDINPARINFIFSDLSEEEVTCKQYNNYFECGTRLDKEIIGGYGDLKYKFSNDYKTNDICNFRFTMINSIPVGSLCSPIDSNESVRFKLSAHLMQNSEDHTIPVLALFRVVDKNDANKTVNESAIEDYVSKFSSNYKQLDKILLNQNKVYTSVNRGFSIGVSRGESNALSILKVSYIKYSQNTASYNAKIDDSIDLRGYSGLFTFKHKSHKNRHIGGLVTIHFKHDNQEKTCKFNQINIEHPYNSKGVIQLGSICINNTQYSVYPDETDPNILRLGLTRDVQSKFIPNFY